MRMQTVRTTLLLSLLTLLLLALGAWPPGALAMSAETQDHQTVTLKIDGLTCGACIKDVRAALSKVQGLESAEFSVGTKWFFFSDYSDVRAIVRFHRGKASVEDFIRAVQQASGPLSAYQAAVLP